MPLGNGNHQYSPVDSWATLPAGDSFLDIGRIATTDSDQVYVLNRSRHRLMTFSPDGNRTDTWGTQYFSDRPHGMCIGPEGHIYCTDDGNHTVRKFDQHGNHLLTLGTEDDPTPTGYTHRRDFFDRLSTISTGAGPFNRPTGVTVLDDGTIFVADGYGNARIHTFDQAGYHLHSWGEPGASTGQFRLPHSIHHDSEDRIWVTDRENSRIQLFTTDGEFLTEWTDVIRPTDIAITDEAVYVAELCCRVSIFTPDGTLLTRFGNEQTAGTEPLFVAPHTITTDSTGALYVGEVPFAHQGIDRGPACIHKLTPVT